jgi:hypothetical protein
MRIWRRGERKNCEVDIEFATIGLKEKACAHGEAVAAVVRNNGREKQ